MRTRMYVVFLIVSTAALAMDWGDILRQDSSKPSRSIAQTNSKSLLETHCLNDNPYACFNLGCIKAKEGKNKEALNFLEQSLKLGFNDWQEIENDKDLKSLRETNDYKSLVSLYKKAH